MMLFDEHGAYGIHCKPYNARYILYDNYIQFRIYGIQYAVHNIVYGVYCTPSSVHHTIVHRTAYIVQIMYVIHVYVMHSRCTLYAV